MLLQSVSQFGDEGKALKAEPNMQEQAMGCPLQSFSLSLALANSCQGGPADVHEGPVMQRTNFYLLP